MNYQKCVSNFLSSWLANWQGQSWRVIKSWYTGGDPEQGFRRCFADRLKQSLVSSVVQATEAQAIAILATKKKFGVVWRENRSRASIWLSWRCATPQANCPTLTSVYLVGRREKCKICFLTVHYSTKVDHFCFYPRLYFSSEHVTETWHWRSKIIRRVKRLKFLPQSSSCVICWGNDPSRFTKFPADILNRTSENIQCLSANEYSLFT